jgi:hypothetical protein
VDIYRGLKGKSLSLNTPTLQTEDVFLSFYCKDSSTQAVNSSFNLNNATLLNLEKIPLLDGWEFKVCKVTDDQVTIMFNQDVDFCEMKFFNLPNELSWDDDKEHNIKGYATL